MWGTVLQSYKWDGPSERYGVQSYSLISGMAPQRGVGYSLISGMVPQRDVGYSLTVL